MRYFFIILVLFCSRTALSEPLRIAVASNFAVPMNFLTKKYQEKYQKQVMVSVSSSGKIYAKVLRGAPYHLFFSADQDKPAKLEAQSKGISGTRQTYAIGRLVLLGAGHKIPLKDASVLRDGQFRFLAIANDKYAPYGLAAKQVIKRLGLEKRLSSKMVVADSITQAYHYVKTGNADLGFVALSQVNSIKDKKNLWIVPKDWHEPIVQQYVAIKSHPDLKIFLEFVHSQEGKQIIQDFGYEVN